MEHDGVLMRDLPGRYECPACGSVEWLPQVEHPGDGAVVSIGGG